MAITHPTDGQWADLVRDLLDKGAAGRLRRHSLRCASCRQTLEAYAAVATLGRVEAAFTPPQEAISKAIVLFPERSRTRTLAWPTLAGILTFDSWQQPALAGVRSQYAGDRHVTFRSGDWEVDLRLETSQVGSVSVLGQVAHTTDHDVRLNGVPVRLLAGRRAVASSTLNAFGEFQLDCRVERTGLRLDIPVSSKQVRLDIPVVAARAGKGTGKKGTT
jgi:hypothetical protein